MDCTTKVIGPEGERPCPNIAAFVIEVLEDVDLIALPDGSATIHQLGPMCHECMTSAVTHRCMTGRDPVARSWIRVQCITDREWFAGQPRAQGGVLPEGWNVVGEMGPELVV